MLAIFPSPPRLIATLMNENLKESATVDERRDVESEEEDYEPPMDGWAQTGTQLYSRSMITIQRSSYR